jgi:hypothetical protein
MNKPAHITLNSISKAHRFKRMNEEEKTEQIQSKEVFSCCALEFLNKK